MKDLLERCARLDVHKDKIVACILSGPLGQPTNAEIRGFTTLIPDMVALRDWIVSSNCHKVSMESTGIYWQPIYEILEDAFSGAVLATVMGKVITDTPLEHKEGILSNAINFSKKSLKSFVKTT